MAKNVIARSICAAALLAGAFGAGEALAGCPTGLNLTGNTNYVQFGDGLSYSIPVLGLSVQSSPGQINDCIVVMSGAGGTVANNALPGLADNAYDNKQGDQYPYFRTGDPINNTDPGGGGQFNGDSSTTWDIRISALKTFLNGGAPMFYFNHNQQNSGASTNQDLYAWGQIILRNDAGAVVAVYDFTAIQNSLGLPHFGEPGGNPGTYNSAGVAGGTYPTGPGNVFPTNEDFVLARGELCLDGPAGTGNIVPCSPAIPPSQRFNTNLGANEVANAVIFPEMNALLATAGAGGATVMQIDFRMGCNAAQLPPLPGTTAPRACDPGSVLNNGYEQLFIVSTNEPVIVPEPGSVALVGISLLGLLAGARRRMKS